jgi:4-diphosphocytidyl-2-C-methyl-D-erythritol kinase
MDKLEIKAYAKINLFLEVTGKRADGYHDLATLFARVSLADVLTLRRTAQPGVRLKVTGTAALSVPAEDNLVYKAALAFFEAFKIKPAAEIELVKKVPVGAGLGGGSSDAAAALSGLCRLYGVSLKRNRGRLGAIALALGSDVPFFLFGGAFSAGAGRGEVLVPFKPKGRLPAIVLVYPGSPVHTGPVYKALKPVPPRESSANLRKFKALIKALKAGEPLKHWGALLFNRLEEPVLPVHAAVLRAREDLLAAGAAAVLMSGSGASVFALAESGPAAAKIAKIVKRPGNQVFLPDFC